MQEAAIAWFVFAWLALQETDLTVVLVRGPLSADPVVKFVICLVALVVIGFAMNRRHWFWGV